MAEKPTEKPKGEKPQFRIVQATGKVDETGKPVMTSVGGAWKHVSKKGTTYWQVSIGNLRLLMFDNTSAPASKEEPDEF